MHRGCCEQDAPISTDVIYRPVGGFERPGPILKAVLLRFRLVLYTAPWAASLKDEHNSHR